MKNSAKVTLLNFNRIDVFRHDVVVLEDEVLKPYSVVGVFTWGIQSFDCRHELQVEWIRANR